jgi:hypothetical protein
MLKPEAPCKDCPNRNPYCHSSCKEYLQFRSNLNRHNAIERRKAIIERASNDYEHILHEDIMRKRYGR